MEKQINLQDLKNKIDQATKSYQQVLQSSHDKALEQNNVQIQRWKDYHREHAELSTQLLSLRDDLTHSYMVPLGRRALMRGRLVHTNELLVSLGDGWFVEKSAKQAADLCQRRIQSCDEMLKKLEKERDLLTSRKIFASENDTFGAGRMGEIIEPYEEEEEKKWREQHRQKVRNYRQKLRDLEKAQPTKIESEEDLWKRLDELDIQEELEDDLHRLDDEPESEESVDDDSEDEETETAESDDNESEYEETKSAESDDNGTRPGEQSEGVKKNTLKRRVSFKEDGESCNSGKKTVKGVDETDFDLIKIFFKHSDNPTCVSSDVTDEIVCPSDIYSQYMSHRMPKSILKPPPSVEMLPSVLDNSSNNKAETIQKHIEPVVKAVSEEVVEQKLPTDSAPNTERPVSRFKAARLASKR